MDGNRVPKTFIVEELLTEIEQRFDIDEQREEEAYAQYAWEKGNLWNPPMKIVHRFRQILGATSG